MSPASRASSLARAALGLALVATTVTAQDSSAHRTDAGVGGQAFLAESHLEDANDRATFGSTTNHSSFATAWSVGGGVYLPIGLGTTNVQLDLGMQYLNDGEARYLAPGSIVDLPDARISVAPLERATHLVILRVGARIGL
jgi:hypothetical protein